MRYTVVNDSKTPYRVIDPTLPELRPAQSAISLQSLTNSQLSEKTADKLGFGQTAGVPVVRSEIEQRDIAPGSAVTGVVAIRISTPGPQLYRLMFGPDGDRPVTASAVF